MPARQEVVDARSRVDMRLIAFVFVAFLSGCASLGNVTRYESHGQQTVCWEPGRALNGVTAFIANKLEAH